MPANCAGSFGLFLPKEVLLAVDVAVPDEALVVEGLTAVGAL